MKKLKKLKGTIKVDTNKNKHYTNQHGMELKDYMQQEESLELWLNACYWSAIKYNIRAGKKAGESKEKDLSKRDDYIEEVLKIKRSYNKEMVLNELNEIKEDFESWKGE